MSVPVTTREAIGEAERQRYESEGILFPVGALEADEVAKFRRAVDGLESLMGGRALPTRASQCHLHFGWAYELSTHSRILDVVESLIGPDILVHSTTLFSKHPGSDGFVSWHQDGHYWNLSVPRLVSAWIALTDSDEGNGCLRVLPGSHHRRFDHVEIPNPSNLLASGITIPSGLDEGGATDVVLKAGEMSLHHADLVHGSNPNRSTEKRIGFAVRYVAPEVRQDPEHHAVVLARGKDPYHHYATMETPPDCGIREGLERQIAFTRRLREMRSAQGRSD